MNKTLIIIFFTIKIAFCQVISKGQSMTNLAYYYYNQNKLIWKFKAKKTIKDLTKVVFFDTTLAHTKSLITLSSPMIYFTKRDNFVYTNSGCVLRESAFKGKAKSFSLYINLGMIYLNDEIEFKFKMK